MSYSIYSNNSYYYINARNQIQKHTEIDDNKWDYVNRYPSEVYSTLLTDSNGELLNEAPEWLTENTRFIIEVDGKKVLCNSGNERNSGIRGEFTATAGISKYTCEYDSDGNKLDTPKDVYDVYITFSEWLTQSPNVSSLKIYRVDDTSNTKMCLSWYDINHVYFYDKEEVNNRITSPDWNSNDVTSPTFIVNKPVGTIKGNNYIFSNIAYFHSNQSTNKLNDGRYYSNQAYFSSSDFWLKLNHIYYVYFNDELYGTIQLQKSSNDTLVSNYDTNNGSPYLNYTGENRIFAYAYDSTSFYMGFIYDENHIIYNNGGASWYPTIKIFDVDENGTDTIQLQLNPKFVDYHSYITDETISDKPFGNIIEYQNTYNNIYDNTISFTQTGPSHYGGTITFTKEPVVGDIIELLIDGVSKGTAEVINNSDMGNRIEFGIGDYIQGFRNDWMVYFFNNTWFLCASGYSSGSSHSVLCRIAEGREIIHTIKKLDSIYVDLTDYYKKSEIDASFVTVQALNQLQNELKALQDRIAALESA